MEQHDENNMLRYISRYWMVNTQRCKMKGWKNAKNIAIQRKSVLSSKCITACITELNRLWKLSPMYFCTNVLLLLLLFATAHVTAGKGENWTQHTFFQKSYPRTWKHCAFMTSILQFPWLPIPTFASLYLGLKLEQRTNPPWEEKNIRQKIPLPSSQWNYSPDLNLA